MSTQKQIMARPKKDIKKNVYIKCRVEPDLKREHIEFCVAKNITPTIHLREFIIQELNKYNKSICQKN